MIILFILMLVIMIVGFVTISSIIKGLDPEKHKEKRKTFSNLRTLITVIPLVICFVTGTVSGIRIIDQTEIGIVKTFGKIDHTISGGLNFVNPISDTVEMMDLRVHVREAAFASYTKDAQPVSAAIEYQYEPNVAEAMNIVGQYGSYEIMETKLAAAVEERAKIVFARYGAMPLLETRSTLSSQVWDEVRELESMFPIKFTNVVVKDIDFSDAFEKAVEAKMEAEQNALRAENEKKEAVTRAEQAKEVAAINAEAAVATAEGEARALEITRAALENMPETWITQQYLEKWNGILPQIMSDGTNLMVTPNID